MADQKQKESKALEDFDYDKYIKRKANVMIRFKAMDKDGNGQIDKRDLPEGLTKLPADVSKKDGAVTFDEFWGLMRKNFWSDMKSPEEHWADAIVAEKGKIASKFFESNTNWDLLLTRHEAKAEPELLAAFDALAAKDKGKKSFTLDEISEQYVKTEHSLMPEEVRLRVLFQEVDINKNGVLSKFEVEKFLNASKDCPIDFAAMDTDGDGKVDIGEFLNYWKRINTAPGSSSKR